MNLTATALLLALATLTTSAPTTPQPKLSLLSTTFTGTNCAHLSTTLQTLSHHPISQLSHTLRGTPSYGPSTPHTSTYASCRIDTTLSYPANEYDLSVLYWNKTTTSLSLQNEKLTAVSNEYVFFGNAERYKPNGFLFGVKTFRGPVSDEGLSWPFFPAQGRNVTSPRIEGCEGGKGAMRNVTVSLDGSVSVQGSNGQTPRSGSEGAPKGEFGGELGWSLELVWTKHDRCQ